MIGQTISHYKIIEKLGEGGMGIVYKAHDTTLEREVAIKFLPRQIAADDEEKKRFKIEAKAAAALNHPNIATIHAIEEVGDEMFIVMEFIRGKELKDLIAEAPPEGIPITDVLRYARMIASGLKAAHSRGIIHRDIKSANIMVTSDGQVKIMDFGLAKFPGTAKLTKVGSTVGTAAYMSPEQIRSEELDHRSDIFSFGILLYELLTTRLPFRGEHEAALSYSIVNEDPIPLKSLRTAIPSSLERVISSCLEKEKEKRYRSAEEIVVEVRAIKQEISSPSSTPNVPRLQSSKKGLIGAAVLLVMGFIAVYVLLPSGSDAVDRKSIAVLPFQNLSDEKENEYFSDGITEDIITQLSKIGDLKVISRTSIMRYKNSKKSLRDIGSELDVAVILEGSVRRSGNRVRIVSQLIDARSDEHIWAETYDKELTEIFAIQSDVAQQIASALKAKLSLGEKKRIERKATESAEAYQLYLRGRFHFGKTEKKELKRAVELFQLAIEKDPHYALAHSGLSDCYSLIAYFQYDDLLPLNEAMQKAKLAATKALEIDEELAEAHTSLGYFKRTFEWDWVGADREFKRAIELNPNYALAYNYSALLQAALGEFDKALESVSVAQRLNPLSLDIHLTHARIFYYARQYDRAVEQLRKAMDIDSSYLKLRGVLGAVYELKGMRREAIEQFQLSRTLTGIDFEGTENYLMSHSGIDPGSYWREALDYAIQQSNRKPVSGLVLATLYTRVGNYDKAVEWLQYAYERREGGLVYLKVEPTFRPLHSDPRFTALLRNIGLEQ